MVLHAQLHHAAQLLGRPDNAQWVVGVAQQEQVGLLQLGLKVGPVHLPLAVLLNKLVLQHPAVPRLGHVVELGIHRGLDEDAAPLGGEQLHHGADGLHHAQAEAHQALVDVPAVAALLPAPDGLKIGVRAAGVAPDALLGPLAQGVNDGLGGLEVHVGDPQGDDVIGAEFLLPLIVLGRAVFAAVNHHIKIILHRCLPAFPSLDWVFISGCTLAPALSNRRAELCQLPQYYPIYTISILRLCIKQIKAPPDTLTSVRRRPRRKPGKQVKSVKKVKSVKPIQSFSSVSSRRHRARPAGVSRVPPLPRLTRARPA